MHSKIHFLMACLENNTASCSPENLVEEVHVHVHFCSTHLCT